MARKTDRAIAGFFAVIFIASVLISALAIVYFVVKGNDATQANTNQQEAKVNDEDKLQGKPLAGFTPVNDIPELKTEDIKQGSGREAKLGDQVTVDYTGAIASTGIVFESSKDSGQSVPFPLKEAQAGQPGVIKGFANGIAGMKEGGTRRIYMPSNVAYGEQGSPPAIPANADLVFDVTLQKTGQ